MKRVSLAALIGCLGSVLLAAPAFCADVTGKVLNIQKQPVSGVMIKAIDSKGVIAGKVLSNDKGEYRLSGLSAGTYTYHLDPLKTGYKSGSAVAALSDDGLTVDWSVSRSDEAFAVASSGTGGGFWAADPFGMSMAGFTGTVAGGLGVAAIGTTVGLSSAGAMGSSGPPSSPAM